VTSQQNSSRPNNQQINNLPARPASSASSLNQVESYNYTLGNAASNAKINGFKLFEMMVPIVNVKGMKSCLKSPASRQFPTEWSTANTSTTDSVAQQAKLKRHDHDQSEGGSNLNEQDYMKFANYKSNLSKIIKSRYNSEPYEPQTQSNMPPSSSKSRQHHTARDHSESRIDVNNEESSETTQVTTSSYRPKSGVKQQHVYGKHIDALTAELLAVFSKEYNRGTFENLPKMRADQTNAANDYDELDDFIQVCDDKDSNTDTGTLRNPLDAGFFDDDDDDDEEEEEDDFEDDEEGGGDDNEEYQNCEDFQNLFCNTNLNAVNAIDAQATHEYVEYEEGDGDGGKGMILETNLKERDFSRDNIVMKIVNEIRAEIGQNKRLSKRMRKRLEMFDVNRQRMDTSQV
jgi:hypothetical protein